MIMPMFAVVGHGSTAFWYLTRATGLVSLVLLSATVVLGVIASVGWTTERWPRFLSQAVHRNLSLFCLVLVGLHVVTTVADGYVPIGYLDAVIPFRTPYRPLWVGFGALAFDLLLAVAITSGLRRRIGTRAWRNVHWLAYVCWPIALLHGLGAGTDTRLSLALIITVLCVVSVVGAIGWRLVTGRGTSPTRRLAAATVGAVTLIGIGVVALAGPLRSGWSHRAGTSPAVLAELNAGFQSSSSASTAPPSSGGSPSPPFSQSVQGTYQTSSPDQNGQVTVVLTLTPSGSTSSPLVVKLNGTSVNGGVSMSSSQVTWGSETGTVTNLQGSTIGATLGGPNGSVALTMQLNLDQAHGTVTGTVSGTSGQ
ncbi:MAG TPA: ferric reductase-like transmembrane domain-containing protein [Acidimicrobiales bacterium]|jgi:DMSO/TMAO reductase YedYZ heme-binding membrane subunit|nr:ferric reductase-like transmembrane domain-containing protein [Acidimicrobiales bacterium]